MTLTEISKKAGDLWKELKDKTKWEELAVKAKKQYEKEMAEYKARGGDEDTSNKSKNRSPKKSSTKSPIKSGNFKSKEYVSSDSDSDSDDSDKGKKKKSSDKPSSKKMRKNDSSSNDEEILSSPEASSDSD